MTTEPATKAPTSRNMRFTENELAFIKSTFKGNELLLKLLRKVFLPEFDPSAPLGQVIDLWMTVDLKDKSPEDAIIEIKARNAMIMHIESMLFQLTNLSNLEDKDENIKKEQEAKDSAR